MTRIVMNVVSGNWTDWSAVCEPLPVSTRSGRNPDSVFLPGNGEAHVALKNVSPYYPGPPVAAGELLSNSGFTGRPRC